MERDSTVMKKTYPVQSFDFFALLFLCPVEGEAHRFYYYYSVHTLYYKIHIPKLFYVSLELHYSGRCITLQNPRHFLFNTEREQNATYFPSSIPMTCIKTALKSLSFTETGNRAKCCLPYPDFERLVFFIAELWLTFFLMCFLKVTLTPLGRLSPRLT